MNPMDKALQALEQALDQPAQDINEANHPAPREVPQWGEEAADIILKMAADRASHIEKFGMAVVKRAEEWRSLAAKLAMNIRDTAEKEAEAIRRETARMLKAGNRIEVAMREFEPEREKYNGGDRRSSEAQGSNPPDGPEYEPIPRVTQAPADAGVRASQGSTSAAREGAELAAPRFLRRPVVPSSDDQF